MRTALAVVGVFGFWALWGLLGQTFAMIVAPILLVALVALWWSVLRDENDPEMRQRLDWDRWRRRY
jgi:predicted PurR-regulated permease PerM